MKIDKNIPIPKVITLSFSKVADKMEVGDSVLIKLRKDACNMCNIIKAQGFKAVTRTVKGGIRVWKQNKS